MIEINKSKTADSRTCIYKNVKYKDILKSTKSHIKNVTQGIDFAIKILKEKAINHDHTKLKYSDLFYKEFMEGFKKTTEWWEMHQGTERHHLKSKKYIPKDVNLFDIIEMIIDGIMAGLARTGKYKKEEIPNDLLKTAFDNTIKLYLDNIKIKE